MKESNIVRLAIVALIAAACSESSAPSSDLAITMASAFSAAPSGFSELSSSFAADAAAGPFLPGFGPRENGHGPGRGFDGPGRGPGFGLGFMGGGLFGPFLGDGFERGFFHSDASCAYASGIVTCGPIDARRPDRHADRRNIKTSGGTSQPKFDSTTNTVTTKVDRDRHDDAPRQQHRAR